MAGGEPLLWTIAFTQRCCVAPSPPRTAKQLLWLWNLPSVPCLGPLQPPLVSCWIKKSRRTQKTDQEVTGSYYRFPAEVNILECHTQRWSLLHAQASLFFLLKEWPGVSGAGSTQKVYDFSLILCCSIDQLNKAWMCEPVQYKVHSGHCSRMHSTHIFNWGLFSTRNYCCILSVFYF